MSGGDGTGPMGLRPMTGRAAGYCAGYPTPGYMNPIPGFGFGRGLGRGWGRGRGFRWFWRAARFPVGYRPYPVTSVRYVPTPAYPQTREPVQPTYTKEDELADLKAEKELIERDLKAIEERIKELERE
jgi:hypothetical protein